MTKPKNTSKGEMKNKYGEAYIQTGVAPWDFHIKDCTCNLCKWKQPIKEREKKN